MQHLEIETPEHVVLDLEIAGIGSRGLAAAIDMAILGGGTFALLLLIVTLANSGGPGALTAMIVAGSWFLYFAFFEGLRRGQTPGKRMVGIRVVSDTGHAVGFSAAMLRNLLRLADLFPPPYLTGMILIALHPRGKRLGDLVAGTVVVRDRPAPAATARRPVAPAADVPAGLPELADAEFHLLERFASRAGELPPRAAHAMAVRLIERLTIAPPPGVGAAAFLIDLHAQELARRQGRLGGAGRDRQSRQFIERKTLRWNEFHAIAERAAGGGIDRFAAAELPDFAARYREIAADLARARTYGADPATLARLERLVAAGHNALYRDERHTGRQIWSLLARECPAAVVQTWRVVALACALFALPYTAGFMLMRERPALAADLVPEVMRRRAEAGANRQAQGLKYITVDAEARPLMATYIINNNVRIAFICFAGGIFLGVGSLVLLAYNGLVIGVTAGHFANMGVLGYLLEFVVGHSVLELFAICVAAAAGFVLGRAIIAPGTLRRADALVLAGRVALRLVGAATVLLIIAGVIEGFVSASESAMGLRVGVAVASLIFLVLYLANGAVSRRTAATPAAAER